MNPHDYPNLTSEFDYFRSFIASYGVPSRLPSGLYKVLAVIIPPLPGLTPEPFQTCRLSLWTSEKIESIQICFDSEFEQHLYFHTATLTKKINKFDIEQLLDSGANIAFNKLPSLLREAEPLLKIKKDLHLLKAE